MVMLYAMINGYKRTLKFDSQEPEFSRGFEAGIIWSLMAAVARGDLMPSDLEGVVFHASNVEMIMRMLEASELQGWRAEIIDDVWMVLYR
jgi:hypothetical protein